MPKFKTLNNQIPGLIRNCSPIRNDTRKGVAVRERGKIILIEHTPDRLRQILGASEQFWTLDLRDPTGAFHAAQYIQEHFDTFEPGEFSCALKNELGSDHHHVYLSAAAGNSLTTPERKALAEIVLWVAERVN